MNVETLLHAVFELVIVGLVFWLIWWLVEYIGLPEPFAKVAKVLIAVVAVLFLVGVLLGFTGGYHPVLLRR